MAGLHGPDERDGLRTLVSRRAAVPTRLLVPLLLCPILPRRGRERLLVEGQVTALRPAASRTRAGLAVLMGWLIHFSRYKKGWQPANTPLCVSPLMQGREPTERRGVVRSSPFLGGGQWRGYLDVTSKF